ncbi:hypothetical protein [uncultured Algoriphagus sp.]|uniref:hypothetical protein n=1 Tax=uncultured Algoriphagus sp. TaxID=417365 RepID=UPI0030EEFB01
MKKSHRDDPWVAQGFNLGIKDYIHSKALDWNYHLELRRFASKMETDPLES